jgi:hypothetical protein
MPDSSDLGSLTASLPPLEKRVRTAAFQAIYRGEKLSAAQLAHRLAEPAERVQMAVRSLLERGLVTADGTGRLTGSHGLSLVPSDHRVTFDVGQRYVWCAVDAVGIPAALGVDAEVTSRCFFCGEPVALTIEKGEPQSPSADLLFIGLGVAGSTGRINDDLCPMINFFCSRGHAEAWATTAGQANIMSVRQAADVGRREWADVNQLS